MDGIKPPGHGIIYYDWISKRPWRTVNTGRWTNEELFLYLLTSKMSQPKPESGEATKP